MCRLIMLVALIAMTALRTESQDNVGSIDTAVGKVDVLHPKQFVRLLEVTSGGDRITLFDPSSDSLYEGFPSIREVRMEVDARSRIVIRFDREWLFRMRQVFEGEISVVARVESPGNTRNIEILGYSMVGESRSVAALRLRAARELVAILNELSTNWGVVNSSISSGLSRIVPRSVASEPRHEVLATAIRRIDSDRTLISEFARQLGDTSSAANEWFYGFQLAIPKTLRIARSVQLQSALVSIPLQPQTAGSSNRVPLDTIAVLIRLNEKIKQALDLYSQAPPVTDTLKGDTLAFVRTLGLFLRDITTISYTLEQSVNQVQVEQNLSRSGGQILAELQRTLLDQRSVIEIPLRKIYDDRNLVLIEVLSRRKARDRDVMSQRARDIVQKWYPLLERTPPNREDSLRNVIVQLHQQLGALVAGIDSLKTSEYEGISRDLIAYLKDSDLLVEESGAQIGDAIVLRIINGATNPENARELRVRLTVRNLGWTTKVLDSFTFIRRLGVAPGEHDRRVGAAIADTGLHSTTTVRSPRPVVFEPAPGVTFLATYQGRDGILRWLKPSLGVNVSFKSFGELVTTVGTSDSVSTQQIGSDAEGNRLDLAAGLVFGLFDNTVSFTYGWSLATTTREKYWGIGFSFVDLGSKIGSVLGL